MITLSSENDTLALGAALAPHVRRGEVVALHGPLGAGKTTFARGFIQQLTGGSEEVVSPTFTLVQVYDTPHDPTWHFDLYRLEKADDVLELGFEDALATGISLIEWPERLGAMLPATRLDVVLALAGTGRTATLSGVGWAERIKKIKV
jgi:tRNA threonylcarbamoyladenosine biosynthesis protein TsaE